MRTFSSEINFVFIVAHIKLASSGICEAKHAWVFCVDRCHVISAVVASHHSMAENLWLFIAQTVPVVLLNSLIVFL